jgi:hypothetical protein
MPVIFSYCPTPSNEYPPKAIDLDRISIFVVWPSAFDVAASIPAASALAMLTCNSLRRPNPDARANGTSCSVIIISLLIQGLHLPSSPGWLHTLLSCARVTTATDRAS